MPPGTTMETTPVYLTPAQHRALRNRVARIEGQVRALREQLETGACADDLILLASAARGGLREVVARLLEGHLVDCARTCMEGDQDEVLHRVARAVSTAMRQA